MPSAELVIIPTDLSRLAGQAIRLVRRIGLSLICFVHAGIIGNVWADSCARREALGGRGLLAR
jgi:hypothetical protein